MRQCLLNIIGWDLYHVDGLFERYLKVNRMFSLIVMLDSVKLKAISNHFFLIIIMLHPFIHMVLRPILPCQLAL